MSGLVIDASVAIKWVIEESGSAAAIQLVGSAPLMAPDLIGAELTNVLWRHVAANRLGESAAQAAWQGCRAMLDRVYAHDELSGPALRMACALGHPAYDCFYLALAEQLDCPMVTADRRFHDRVADSEWRHRVTAL
ncbi:type II toxin-antitoxin system VapC family toxin [Magnetospirillum moscoviense]|uniref:Ribonuclease VapC n=1 Tax=Magnetospirillum moscoviense TaxID=1437059 RepID=A0A178MX76_9PROT|nr:type II toxin-antitoxin system VapC family toxin [Magnetospirillum moscoviense]MBF0325285.1 type II toxin-antitoxin system VapC family toxin [Alphaproteobacteria bacterium]OAN54009.1 hypothetical protein A6A05_09360 [Magnetospirillum moscoviense]